MIKHFCDEPGCGKELSETEMQVSAEMIGIKEFCHDHIQKYLGARAGKYTVNYIKSRSYKKDPSSGFIYPID